MGQIKVKWHRPVEGAIQTVTIKREAGRWFAIFSGERDAVPLPARDPAIGIDVGLNSFATLSDGTEVPNPRHYGAAEARFGCAQPKVARRNNRSNRRPKAVRLWQRAHAHARNERRNFEHKLSRPLANPYGVIAVEDLSIQGVAGRMLAKSVHDAGW